MSHTETAKQVVDLTDELPDSEVEPKAQSRQFSAKYKLGVLEEADACTESGQIGALLRREGLYSSHLSTWRRQRREGELEGLLPNKRGRKGQEPQAIELAHLREENERLQARLQQAEMIIDVQKKLSQLLGLTAHENQKCDSE